MTIRISGSPSVDANTLDFYQEGTWTPVLAGQTSAGVGTYTRQIGRYTRIGNVVHISCGLGWSAHTGTGNMIITGLPFAVTNVTGQRFNFPAESNSLTFTGNLVVQLDEGNILSPVVYSNGAAHAMVAMDTVADLWFSGAYMIT